MKIGVLLRIDSRCESPGRHLRLEPPLCLSSAFLIWCTRCRINSSSTCSASRVFVVERISEEAEMSCLRSAHLSIRGAVQHYKHHQRDREGGREKERERERKKKKLYAVKFGSGPIFPLLKVRFWTNLKVWFWTKMILAYFYSGFRRFLCKS